MSQIKLKHSGGNSVIIAAPDSNPASDRTLKLPSNADGEILTDQSSLDSTKLSPAISAGSASFRVKLNNNQNLSDSVYTKVLFDTEYFDPDGVYDASNSKFIAPSTGTYFFTASLRIDNGSPNIRDSAIEFKKNGSSLLKLIDDPWESFNRYMTAQSLSITANLAANDEIEVYAYTNNTGQTAIINYNNSIFGGFRLS